MRIKEGLKLEPNENGRVEIPDCSRDDLPQFFNDRGFKLGVEVGVYRGEFTEKLCKAGLKVYGIDPYMQHRDYHANRPGYKDRCEVLYKNVVERMKPYDCEIIRKTSADAVNDFEDESLDFVYIDGNHQLKYVIEDIHEWLPKIKKGGIIAGHDYVYFQGTRIQVREAVDTYTFAYNIKPWYVLGSSKRILGEKRDKWRSWMWIKE